MGELSLPEVSKEVRVATMAIGKDDLLEPVPRELVTCFLQHLPDHVGAVCDCPGLMLCLEDLSNVILREDHTIVLSRRTQYDFPHVEEVRTQGQLRSMLFQNADRYNAHSLGLCNCLDELGCRQFLILNGETCGWSNRCLGRGFGTYQNLYCHEVTPSAKVEVPIARSAKSLKGLPSGQGTRGM